MHECPDIDRVTQNVQAALEPGGWFVISDLPFPDTDQGLRNVPGRIMSGIQFFEAQIDDQLLPRTYYDDLLRLTPSPVIALNRAVALAMVAGPEAGLAELEQVRTLPGMNAYYLLHVTTAELHRRTGDTSRAIEHYRRAQSLTTTAPEQRFLARKLAEVRIDRATDEQRERGPYAAPLSATAQGAPDSEGSPDRNDEAG